MNRRYFMAAAAAGASLASCSYGANDRIRVAIVGLGSQGRHLTGKFAAQPDVEIAYLCETDQRHGPATILACNAGKDVYVEKPASHNLREGRLMVEAARKNNRIVQMGIQSRSRPTTQQAIELVRSGKIGKVLAAKAWDVQLRDHIGHKEDSPVPAGVDYETWTGPAPLLPFNENRFHYKWHWNWNYGTGDIGNDGVHQLDIARWAVGVDLPTEVSGMGRKLFFDDDQRTPDTMNITYNYPGNVLQFEMRIWAPYGMENIQNGVAVYGTDAFVHIARLDGVWGYRLYDSKGKLVTEEKRETDADPAHVRNFLDCVRSRKVPNGEIGIGHISSSLCQLGNIVTRTGRTLRYDGSKETIAGDPESNKLLTREYRRHWATPKV